MSISLLDNLSIKKKSPNVERDLFNTVADMVAFSENYLPSVFECNVIEDGCRYRYNVSNAVDPILGKWRLVSSEGSGNLVDYYKKTEVDNLLTGYQPTETGKGLSTNDYTTLEKEKLAGLENYDDTAVRTHITTSEQAITDIQTVIGTDTLITTAQTLTGSINEVKSGCDSATSAVAERVTKNEQAITVLNSDETVSGSVKEASATTLAEAKTYTDQQILAMDQDTALVVDAKPTYNPDDGTVTYVKDGVTDTTEGTEIWFYYMQDGKLMQTIWIGDSEMTVVSAGGVNFNDYVSKLTDIVSTYNGAEVDTAKVPDLAAMKALQLLLQANIDGKVSGDDILDALDSSSITSALSANQGRVLNELINTKLNSTFTGDDVANKSLATDSMGKVILTAYDEALNDASTNAIQNKVVKAELDKKLDIEQSVDKAGYIPVVGEDGNLVLRESSTLGGTAEVTTYTNADYPELTNVDLALDKILAKLYYVAPAINSFTITPATTEYEIGTVVPANTLVFNWTINKDITGQTLTDCTVAVDDRTAIYGSDLSATKTFTLAISDGENSATLSKKISFLNKVYWGSAAIPGEYNSAFILGLSNGKLASGKASTYAMTVGAGEYGYLAVPTSFGNISSCWIGGFEVTLENAATISFTNASGHNSSYAIYKTGQAGLGSISMQIK